MPTYHPLYSGLWDDEALDGMEFEGKAAYRTPCTS